MNRYAVTNTFVNASMQARTAVENSARFVPFQFLFLVLATESFTRCREVKLANKFSAYCVPLINFAGHVKLVSDALSHEAVFLFI